MNRAALKRWLNEYIDGEIGLAEKAELERMMSEDPALRKEYKALRQIGLYMSYMPDVNVHQQKFRQRFWDRVDSTQREYFSPNRAFAAAMLVFLLVIGLTFGMYMYQQGMFNSQQTLPTVESHNTAYIPQVNFSFDLAAGVPTSVYLNRLALEAQLGLIDNSLLGSFVATRVFEGAVCNPRGGLNQLNFPGNLPKVLQVRVTPQQAVILAQLATDLAGRTIVATATDGTGSTNDLRSFISENPGSSEILLRITFN